MMQYDMRVKIPQENILEAYKKLNEIPCLRIQAIFDYIYGNWRTSYSCDGYGNGYGVSCYCSETCKLRITDLNRCEKIETDNGYYLVQDNF